MNTWIPSGVQSGAFSFSTPANGCTPEGFCFMEDLSKMNVTNEEMALLQVILDAGHSQPNGEAIKLANLWRKRGLKSSEFQLLVKEKVPLGSSSSLSLHSLSSSPSVSPPKESGVVGEKKTQRKLKLSLDLVLGTVQPDLTLQSPAFLSAWRAWIKNRLQLRNPTLGSFEEHMRICKRLGETRAISAIRHSIACCYLSIYEPRQNQKFDNRDKVGASL